MSIEIDRLKIPQWYDDNTMMLLAVNPYIVFLYWEFAFGQVSSLQGKQQVLRLYEQRPRTGYEKDTPLLLRNVVLPPMTTNWYFFGLKPNHRYRAEIGYAQSDCFYVIIKSNTVQLPPASPFTAETDTDTDTEQKFTKIAPVPENVIVKKRPVRQTMKEVFDTMTFYMGIKQDYSQKGE